MGDYSHYKHLRLTRVGDVLTIAMVRRNHASHTELSQVFAQVRADPARVIVLTGVDDVFLGQRNLEEYVEVDEFVLQQTMREARWIIRDILDLPQPLVVALNGSAEGIGASLVSFGDVVVAVEGTTISDPHIERGLTAGDGGAMIFPFLFGWHRAKRFFLLNETITAEELLELGVVTRVVPRAELAGAVHEVTDRLASLPPQALQWTKMTLNKMLQLSILVSADSAVGHEGWSWHLESAQTHIAEIKSNAANNPMGP